MDVGSGYASNACLQPVCFFSAPFLFRRFQKCPATLQHDVQREAAALGAGCACALSLRWYSSHLQIWTGALQDGDMAGLDGLETVGLDCWEGFGTVSMGRL